MAAHSSAIKILATRQNQTVQELRAVRDDAAGPLLFLEGPKLVEEALKSGLWLERLAFVAHWRESALHQEATARARERFQLTPYVLEGISSVPAPQGVIAIARKPATDWKRLLARAPRLIMVLDGVQDAGNAAAIVRTAEAAGAAGLITTPGSARLFSAKALRGAMGSSLRLPILEHLEVDRIAENLAAARYVLLTTAAASADSRPYSAVDWKRACACVLGQESGGVSPRWDSHAPTRIHIPMDPAVESLNVAAAAAVLLYEARRSADVF